MEFRSTAREGDKDVEGGDRRSGRQLGGKCIELTNMSVAKLPSVNQIFSMSFRMHPPYRYRRIPQRFL
jgi:hypothetical protein